MRVVLFLFFVCMSSINAQNYSKIIPEIIFCKSDSEPQHELFKSRFIFKEFEEDSITIYLGDSLIFTNRVSENPFGYEDVYIEVNWADFKNQEFVINFHGYKRKVSAMINKSATYIYMYCNIDAPVSEIRFENGQPVEEILISVPDDFTFIYCNSSPNIFGLD